MDLAAAVHQLVEEALRARRKVGTVTAVSGTQVIVTVNGGSLLLSRMAHYTPTVGDTVQIDATIPGSWLVLGRVA